MESKEPLGVSPAVLAKRDLNKPSPWCQKFNIDFDIMCDPDNPKTILPKDVLKAAAAIKEDIPKTPLNKSRFTKNLKMDLYYKLELFHRTGSFSERGALYALKMLNKEQQNTGVITASIGNWAMALAYHGRLLDIPVTVVLPENTLVSVVEKCLDCGATAILKGNSLEEAKLHAFTLLAETGATYINGYDHPHVIAGAGTIGLEILEQLPQTDAILVPVSGGALIAGIAAVVKHFKPEVLIYILVNDDWITRAVLHILENEKIIVEGAGAVSMSALLAIPNILPELREKNVVCVITGGNMDVTTLPKCLERAKAVEGRLIKLTVMLPDRQKPDDLKLQTKVLSMIGNVGGNVLQCYIDRGWITSDDLFTIYLTLIIETNGLEQACTLKRVMERLFPGKCEFLEEPFSPIPICACFPKRLG